MPRSGSDTRSEVLRRTHVLLALAELVAILVVAPAAAADVSVRLMPGVRYTKDVRWSGGHRIVTHAVVAPPPGGLYSLRPVLSGGLLTGRATVSSMTRSVRWRGTAVAVNGDFFNVLSGRPTGMYMRRRVLVSPPYPKRSSVGITTAGLLTVAEVSSVGTWQAGSFPRHRLAYFNHVPLWRDGVSLYTREWGLRTATGRRQFAVVVTPLRRVRLAKNELGVVVAVVRGGGVTIPRGGAVLQARGEWGRRLVAEAPLGATVTARVDLRPAWDDVSDAVGGGPVLVRNGRAVTSAGEDFLRTQIEPRAPRSAIGQRADGRIVLYAVDGRSRASAGLTIAGLAHEMARLGCVRAMALDGGGSTTLAFDGHVLNRPSDGAERAVSDALAFVYSGVYVPRPSRAIVTPDGDGRGDDEHLAYRVVRPSTVTTSLVSPEGTVAWQVATSRPRGTYAVELPNANLSDGRWRWSVAAVDSLGRRSAMSRRFFVNRTVASMDLRPTPVPRGRSVAVRFTVERPSDTRVTIRRHGRLVRVVAHRWLGAGSHVVRWTGRTQTGRLARLGSYVVRVRTLNRYGSFAAARGLQVVSAP